MSSKAIAISTTVIVVIAMLTVAVVSAVGGDTTALVGVVAGLAGTAITNLFMLARIINVHEKVTQIDKNVNGRMSELIARVPEKTE